MKPSVKGIKEMRRQSLKQMSQKRGSRSLRDRGHSFTLVVLMEQGCK